jgi:glycosyltransferase involved in cell wall biosynthesis
LEQYPRKEMVFLAKWIDVFLTVNQKLTNYWQSLLPYKSNFIQTIPNFPFLSESNSAKFENFTFLNVANYRPQKDQLNLIEAAKLLNEQGKTFQVLLLGEEVDLNWKSQMQKLIDLYHLEDKIYLLGPKENASVYMAQSHVGVLSSESEGLPVALLEYGLSGLPVISTDVGDCKKVVSSSQFGWIVPPKSPQALANAMMELMDDYSLAKQKGLALKSKVQSEFGAEAFFQAYLQFLPKS